MADETTDTTATTEAVATTMSVQYTFKKIDSISNTINISFNDISFMTFNKSDYTSTGDDAKDFDLLLGKSFDISPVDCNDLSGVKVVGSENHNGTVSEELNTEWKEYAHNKLGSKHFKDTAWLSTLDNTSDIVIYNQNGTLSSKGDLSSLLNSIPTSSLPSGYTVDLSNISVSTTVTSSIDYWGCGNNSGFDIGSSVPYCSKYISKSYKLPNGLINLRYAFYECSSLKETPIIPETVTNMECAFQGCSSLEKVTNLPKTMATTDAMYLTFCGCKSLKEVPDFPDGFSINGDALYQTFSNCTSLTEIKTFKNFPPKLWTTFAYCTGLKSICEIPEGITQLDKTFMDCTSLETLPTIPSSVTYYGQAFLGCTNINKVMNNEILGLPVNSDLALVGFKGDGTSTTINNVNYIEAVSNRYYYYGFLRIENIGIVNLKSSSLTINTSSSTYNIALYPPMFVVALPYYLNKNIIYLIAGASNANLPTSTGYEWWVDYLAKDTDYVKTITNKNLELSEHIDTLSNETKSGDYTITTDSLITASPDYKHTFELTEITSVSVTTSSLVNCSKITATSNEDGTVTFTLSCTNIEDNSISSGTVTATVIYVANIDGYEFHGKTVVNCNIALDFTNIEDIGIEITSK